MSTPNTKYESAATTGATNGQDSAAVKRSSRIEAYGVKGMENRPWRRIFKDAGALVAWCEKHGAEVYGQRFVDGQ